MKSDFPAVGAFVKDTNTCSFTVWAPLKDSVEVLIGKPETPRPLTKNAMGYWSGTIANAREGMPYYFLLDGEKKLPDPASRAQPEGVHGHSMIVSQEYAWSDDAWKGLPLGEMIIYEIHVGTFTQSHDFEGVISKLSHLKKLGVNALELMPLSQFPGMRNWGYDGVFPFAVQTSYGGVHGLKKLVDEAHRSGIAVILDVVYNHQGPEGNYFSEYGPYFTEKYKTGWGKAINFDDAWCDGVRNYYWQNALMWLDEFHIDGLRLDAVHAIYDLSASHFIEVMSKKVKALERQCGRRKVLVAEFDLNDPRYISPFSKGGYELDGQWADEFHHALHALITGEVDGYYEDFGTTEHLAKSLRESYVYTGQYSRHRKKYFGRPAEGSGYDQFVVFAQNHDQVGNRMLGDRLSAMLSKEALKLTAATVLLSAHVPMLFMGEEYGETNPFRYFISHTDKDLVERVRKGRREEFSYFNWQGEVPDPQSEKTFQQCVLSWDIKKENGRENLFAFYQHLISLRKTRTAMQGRTRNDLVVLSSTDKTLCFERKFQDDYLLILLNFNRQTVSVTMPVKQKLKKILDSSASQWAGPGEVSPAVVEVSQTITLNPESIMIFEL